MGREFRSLRLIIAHLGLPWVEEALFLLTKHPNFYGELSYFITPQTREELYRFLLRCEPYFVPLEKLFFGSDYPGFTYDPVELREKLQGILGNNLARVLRLLPDSGVGASGA